MPWGIQSMQAVWWGVRPPPHPVQNIFQTAIGRAPHSTQATASGVTIAIGAVDPSVFRIQVQANRTDFFETPQPNPADDAYPLFQDFQGAIQRFRQRLGQFSSCVGDVVRLALVVTVSEEVATLNQANAVVLSKVGFTLPFQDGTDLIFQINRRKPLQAVTGRELNRVMKWLIEGVQTVSLPGGPPVIRSAFLSTLSVDVNIVPTAQAFTAAQQDPIFQEIADETERLCMAKELSALS